MKDPSSGPRSETNETNIWQAAKKALPQTLRALISKGTSPDCTKKNEDGTPLDNSTPLHHLVMTSNLDNLLECMRLLLDSGANKNAKNFAGFTPLGIINKRLEEDSRNQVKKAKELLENYTSPEKELPSGLVSYR